MNTRNSRGGLAALLAASALAGCSMAGAPAADTDLSAKTAEEVKTQVDGLVAAFNARDADKAVSYDSDDYVGMFHGAPNVAGPAEDLAMTKQQVADPALKLVVTDQTIDAAKSGELAVARMRYTYTYTDPATKAPKNETGNWLLGWKRGADGTMKAAWGVVSDAPAGTATAASNGSATAPAGDATPSPAPTASPTMIPTASPSGAATPN
jgi:ketosteroid isomerase-like protein